MSIAELRGGFPKVFTAAAVPTGGRHFDFRQFTKYLQIYTTGNPAILFFTEADFTAGTNGVAVPIAAATHPWGWEGPADVCEVWIKGDGGNAAITIIAYLRRG